MTLSLLCVLPGVWAAAIGIWIVIGILVGLVLGPVVEVRQLWTLQLRNWLPRALSGAWMSVEEVAKLRQDLTEPRFKFEALLPRDYSRIDFASPLH